MTIIFDHTVHLNNFTSLLQLTFTARGRMLLLIKPTVESWMWSVLYWCDRQVTTVVCIIIGHTEALTVLLLSMLPWDLSYITHIHIQTIRNGFALCQTNYKSVERVTKINYETCRIRVLNDFSMTLHCLLRILNHSVKCVYTKVQFCLTTNQLTK